MLYIKVSEDKYELIEAVADSVSELAKLCGVDRSWVYKHLKQSQKTGEWSPYQAIPETGEFTLPKWEPPCLVLQLTKEGRFIKVYQGYEAAAKNTGVPKRYIKTCTSGVRKSAGGFCWKEEPA